MSPRVKASASGNFNKTDPQVSNILEGLIKVTLLHFNMADAHFNRGPLRHTRSLFKRCDQG